MSSSEVPHVIQRILGPRSVSAIGLGGMPMSIEGRPDAERSIATIHAALDAGVTLIDTADAYHLLPGEVGHNEELIARALKTYGGDTASVLVATKGGTLASWRRDLDPERAAGVLEGSGEGVRQAARCRGDRVVPVSPSGSAGAVCGF